MTLAIKTMTPWVPSLLLILFSTVALADLETCGRTYSPAGFDESNQQSYTGVYASTEYRYSVTIPHGFVGSRNDPLLPNHGFSIMLSEKPLAYIYFYASYDVLDTETATNFQRRSLAYLKKNKYIHIVNLRTLRAILATTPAQRHMARITCKNHSGIYVEDVTLAVRDGIEYTAGLFTTERRYKRDVALVNKMLTSWQWSQD